MRIARSTLIGTAVAMALFGRNGAVQAQESASATPPKPSDLQEVVVHGYRASLRESLESKRQATGVEDDLTAEDVGKFPDKNLAEALQRVPGVVINREFGEGERINLRGTIPTLTKTTLNGHALATADWFILDQLNTTRSFNYLMLPADLIGKVRVLKSAQADVEEGGIGGTVDVETRKPLDLQPFTAYASVQGAYTETSGKTDPQGTALISWKDKRTDSGFCSLRSTRSDTCAVTALRCWAMGLPAAPTPRSCPRLSGPLCSSRIASARAAISRCRSGRQTSSRSA